MSAPAAQPSTRPSVWKYLYNNNPFYAISAVLMLYAVQVAYGPLKIGMINTWIMMGVLAGYTVVLAVIAVLIVRMGRVWDDARSIMVLLLLLFLAVSLGADDLFVKISSFDGRALLMAGGILFSAVVSEAVFRGVGIRLGIRYRVPFHLMLASFYVAPWWYALKLHPELLDESHSLLEWTLILFPAAMAVLFLSLLPAVRGGSSYVAQNGTPWRWPLFPWTAFGVIAAAVSLRSFALCMTFGPKGAIWQNLSGGIGINFNTIWGPYFLVPLGLAILMLVLETGLVSGNRRLLIGVMGAAPLLFLMSIPFGGGFTFRAFLRNFTDSIGSPVWVTTWLLIGFYGWAWLRRAPRAGVGFVAALAALSVIGPRTLDWPTLVEPQPWPFLLIGALLIVQGARNRSSQNLRCRGFDDDVRFMASASRDGPGRFPIDRLLPFSVVDDSSVRARLS